MNPKTAKKIIESLIAPTDIKINGNRPSDIIVHNENLYQRVLTDGVLGFGEAYMDGWWDCEELDVFIDKIIRGRVDYAMRIPLRYQFRILLAKLFNFQSLTRSKEVAEKHYDLGNSLFQAMLDKRMIYSCAYYRNTNNLDDAQEAKLDLICQKLLLQPGMRILDIGCGWGGLAKFAAERYQVSVVGVTISKQQYEYAKENCKNLSVDIRLQDYRDINETYDRIVSVGMFEHVGPQNYRSFMEISHRALKPNGIFLLHTIGGNEPRTATNEWINKYIFPNGILPAISQIATSFENLFVMEDWHNFGVYYDKTLMAWYKNFLTHWPELKKNYDERFFRMWRYYLLSCAGSFRARANQLWQIVLSKDGITDGYIAPR